MRGGFVTLPPESLVARGRAAAGRALELDSMVSDAWLARGRLLTGQGPDVPAQILALYARAVLLDPRSAEAHLYYGLALMNQRGDDGAADIEFRRAVELEPDQFRGLRALGNNALVQRRYAEAVIWLDSALVVQPGPRSWSTAPPRISSSATRRLRGKTRRPRFTRISRPVARSSWRCSSFVRAIRRRAGHGCNASLPDQRVSRRKPTVKLQRLVWLRWATGIEPSIS